MNIEDLAKQIADMRLLYGDNVIITVTDGKTDYRIKAISGKPCAKYFEPRDKVAEVIISVTKK